MPPRTVVVLIVGFWLATTSWLLYREWWQWVASRESPPFEIELSDEASEKLAMWVVLRDGTKIGTAYTRTAYHQPTDSFDIFTQIDAPDFSVDLALPGPFGKATARVPRIKNTIRVNRAGELMSMDATIELQIAVARVEWKLKAGIHGDVRGDDLHPRAEFETPVGKLAETLPPARLATRHVLNPNMPVKRIGGLRPGRHWRLTGVDTVTQALLASVRQAVANLAKDNPALANLHTLLPNPEPTDLLAEVLRQRQTITVKDQAVECHVIEYRSDEVRGRTWVRVTDGEVVRQDAVGNGETLTFLRDNLKDVE